ncbi:MAG: hypothetical protein LBU65_02025 [Planctomycetaceae bacterium]|jgi:5-hydroxyisourate hydrolase-like protein (transthyretin family)|nr:hypothetical protein [Planctomycetaceae bacterium]
MKKLLALVSILCIVTVAGCGGPLKPDGFPPLYPVSLVVTQDGKPSKKMTVQLISTDPSSTWAIGGQTDDNGKAKIVTHGQFDGVPLGKYKVVLNKIEMVNFDEYMAAKERRDEAAASKIDVKQFSCVEKQYNTVGTTPLEIEVTKSSKVIEIDAGPVVQIPEAFMK